MTFDLVTSGLAFTGPEMWIVILLVALLLFGGKKIPELMRGVGKGMGELQKGLEEGKRSLHESTQINEEAKPAITAQTPPESLPREEPKTPA